MTNRLRAKRDKNERDIIRALEQLGCSVQALNCTAPDIPDLLVGFRGVNILLEVKERKGKLSEGQAHFMETWQGQCVMARTPEEAVRTVIRGSLIALVTIEDRNRIMDMTIQYLGIFADPLQRAIDVVAWGKAEFSDE